MSLPSQAIDALVKAGSALGPALKAIELLGPLLKPTADYIAGEDVELPPELPTKLRSDIELARLDALAAKAK